MSKVTSLHAVSTAEITAINLNEIPTNRYGFKYVGMHHAFQPTWVWSVGELYLGATTVAKLMDVHQSHEGFPLANANIIPVIEEKINSVPESWIGKEIYILGTTFANNKGDEYTVSFVISSDNERVRTLAVTTRPFLKDIGSNSRILLHRE
jgi:hypothetical protein